MTEIHYRLKKMRMFKGFKTSSDFARYAGVEEATYRHHENGTRGLTIHALKKYADLLNICSCWLLTGQGGGRVKNNEPKSNAVNVVNTEHKKTLITSEFLSLTAKEKRETLKILVGFAHKSPTLIKDEETID